MDPIGRLRNWSGPPLVLQIMFLLIGGLVVAQLVTLLLTVLLPPAPPPQYDLRDIARLLLDPDHGKRGLLQRRIQPAPPAPSGARWLTSDRSRRDLAKLIGTDERYVRLYFYTPMPFAGTVQPPPRLSRLEVHDFDDGAPPRRVRPADGFIPVNFQVAQASPGPGFPGGGFPGGFPGSGFPGGGGGNFPGMGGSFPGGRFPDGGVPGANAPGGGMPGGTVPRPPIDVPQPPAGGPAPTPPMRPPAPVTGAGPGPVEPGGGPSSLPGMPNRPGGFPGPVANPIGAAVPGTAAPMTPVILQPSFVMTLPDVEPPVLPAPPPVVKKKRVSVPAAPAPRLAPPRIAPDVAVTAPHAPTVTRARPDPKPRIPAPAAVPAEPIRPIPRGLFGLMPAPFVQGDFVAALELGTGEWAVVQPVPEPFPNSWQRRVFLWFVISFAIVAPFGWLFARRLVRPISGFALAAEKLGRDLTAPVLPVEGPAEVGRAAHAFNRMQSRLRSFVDDRTAMVGAISHDLRTPLTRLRFRLEDVPDDIRDPMLADVDEMEQMISSVLAFIRDASEPGSREWLDLRTILEDVIEDATFVGKQVTLEESERAPVEVDPLGIRRLLGNLVENAVKYGERARVRLFTDRQEVVAEISDDGPGLPDEELERVFQPFYRAPAARASNKHGTGLGLAVCRSIARAHGGDVQLRRGARGLIAQLRLPMAYGMADG